MAVKSTVGLCWVAFFAAGTVKMNFRNFLKYSFYGGIVWSGFLVIMGYFYGYLWREIKRYIDWAGWLVATIALLTFVVIMVYKNRQSKKIVVEDK
jgi:membrane protein DedA with SNARE-associated domain